MIKINDDKFINKMVLWLNLILLIKIAGYFTVSENVAITRVLKIIFRTGCTAWIIYIYRLLKNQGNIPSFQFNNLLGPVFYSLYLFLGLCSFLWSTNVGYSALQWIMNTESFVFAYYFLLVLVLIQQYYPTSKLRFSSIMANSSFWIMLIFIIGVIFDPDDFYRLTHGGEEARLGGYFMNPNELGMLSVIGASTATMELSHRKRKWPLYIYIGMALAVLILTGSRSSLIGFVLTITYFVNQSDNKKMKTLIYVGMIAAMPAALTTIIFKQGDVEEVLSMTGRLPFWTALLSEGLPLEPLLGFGYMRIAYGEFFQSVHTYAGQMTHNTFIQVLMNLGFIGFTIVVLQMFVTIRSLIYNKDVEKKKFFMALFIPCVINSFTEFGIFGETNYGILFWQLLIFLAVVEFNPKFSIREKVQLKKAIQRGKKIPFQFQ